jgi:hypothetical protein
MGGDGYLRGRFAGKAIDASTDALREASCGLPPVARGIDDLSWAWFGLLVLLARSGIRQTAGLRAAATTRRPSLTDTDHQDAG